MGRQVKQIPKEGYYSTILGRWVTKEEARCPVCNFYLGLYSFNHCFTCGWDKKNTKK